MILRICVAGRNHADFTEPCLSSMLTQQGPPFLVDWTDDASDTVDAYVMALRMLEGNHHVERRQERRGGLANLWHAIQRADDDDVCVLVGGDDWIEPGALARIAAEYEDPNCWLTYGSFRNTDDSYAGNRRWEGADPRDSTIMWQARSCRAWLAKKILVEDLQLNGWFFWSAGDVALTLPLTEMAGPDRATFIEDVWYVRRIHAQCDHRMDLRLQTFCSWMGYAKPRYSQLATPADIPLRTLHTLNHSILFPPHVLCGQLTPYGGPRK